MDTALLVAAALFCVVTGANDGAAVVAMSGRISPALVLPATLVLTGVVALVPLASSEVAVTLARRLVGFEGGAGPLGALVAIVAALAVVAWLTLRGEPTSLTLAIVGALTGAGLGWGEPVAWGLLGSVLVIAAVAPFVAAALASTLTGLAARLRPRGPLRQRIERAHRVAFGLQALAYAGNDGQKMLAVAALTAPALIAAERPSALGSAVIAALFLVGTVVGLGTVARTLGGAVLPVRPTTAVTAEASAGLAVAASAALAAPVSMTQAVTGGILGSNVQSNFRGIRWQAVARIGRAWVLTLPVAFAVAAGASALLRWAGAA
jgi:inorganic phosphate transporter, PiT family